jgi:hypothetical protein
MTGGDCEERVRLLVCERSNLLVCERIGLYILKI